MSDEDKVEVEAEQGQGGKGVVLTVVSVPERRRLMKTYGVHNAYVRDLRSLGKFPTQYITDFYKGSPVRFKMNKRGYERLLESPRAEALGGLNGLAIAMNKEGLTWEEWVRAVGRDPKKLTVEEIRIFTNGWRRGDDPSDWGGATQRGRKKGL
jgi:hypothetical protein